MFLFKKTVLCSKLKKKLKRLEKTNKQNELYLPQMPRKRPRKPRFGVFADVVGSSSNRSHVVTTRNHQRDVRCYYSRLLAQLGT